MEERLCACAGALGRLRETDLTSIATRRACSKMLVLLVLVLLQLAMKKRTEEKAEARLVAPSARQVDYKYSVLEAAVSSLSLCCLCRGLQAQWCPPRSKLFLLR